MRKTFLIFLVFAGITKIEAQENIIKASLLYGNAGLQYERSLSQHFSLVGQAGLGFSNYSDTHIANDFSTGFGYYFEGRYYFSSTKDKMTGWHIGPSVNIAKTTSKKTAIVYESNIYSLSAGSQWIFESKLSFEFFLAIGYQDIKSGSEMLDPTGLPVMPSGGISVGYAF
ncbi:DUF3575 domain-containing protein [Flavobacterium sp.]|uniref:DUF3575 domain-containing protein n=1 Tax=Flavobacterium sp. TaxID=239 RepID=UPI0038FC8902